MASEDNLQEEKSTLPVDDFDDDDDDEAPLLVEMNDAGTCPDIESQSLKARKDEKNNDIEKAPTASSKSCPVSILSGFLGSGKTTLIQYILSDMSHGKKIAVIENEYGEGLAIESLIAMDGINKESLTDLIELPNGCICCTVKDSLVATLENLLSKKSELDYILIESSGMANPGPIASIFWLDDELESQLALDGIITVVDSSNILQQLESTEEASQQIAYADRILLNKIDLIDDTSGSNIETITSVIRQINPTVPIQTTSFSKVPDLNFVLDSNAFHSTVLRAQQLEQGHQQQLEQEHKHADNHEHDHEHEHDHDHNHDHDHDHDHDYNHDHDHNHQHCTDTSCDHCDDDNNTNNNTNKDGNDSSYSTNFKRQQQQDVHRHTSSVSTISFAQNGSIDLKKMNQWLASILWPNQDEKDEVLRALVEQDRPPPKELHAKQQQQQQQQQIFRIKGILSVKHSMAKDDEAQLDPAEKQAFINTQTGLDQRRYIVQAVYDLWNIYPASDQLLWEDDNSSERIRTSKLVIIGKYLHQEELNEGFQNCFYYK